MILHTVIGYGIFPSSGGISTIVWLHHLDFNETPGNKFAQLAGGAV